MNKNEVKKVLVFLKSKGLLNEKAIKKHTVIVNAPKRTKKLNEGGQITTAVGMNNVLKAVKAILADKSFDDDLVDAIADGSGTLDTWNSLYGVDLNDPEFYDDERESFKNIGEEMVDGIWWNLKKEREQGNDAAPEPVNITIDLVAMSFSSSDPTQFKFEVIERY